MRILHVIPSVSRSEGGPSHVLPLMVEGLSQRGHELVIATTHGKAEIAPSPTGAHHSFPRQSEFYKVSFPLTRWVSREVREFDLVHIHALFSHSSVEAARIAAKSGVPYVIRPLGVLNQYGVTSRRRWLKQFSLACREAPVIRKAGAMHFTSEAEKNEAELLGIPMNSRVIPLGIQVPETIPEERPKFPNTILFLSRIDPKKNLEALIDAWSSLDPEVASGWTLRIAGSGNPSYVESLKSRARQSKNARMIEWCGFVEGAEKQRLFSEATLFALPSFSENFGIAAVEAMGAGIPSLLTAGVAVGAAAAECGGCALTDTSSSGIAAGLSHLMRSAEDRRQIAHRGHDFVRAHYSVETMAESLESLYAELTQSRS